MSRAISFFPPETTSVATGHSTSREPTSLHHIYDMPSKIIRGIGFLVERIPRILAASTMPSSDGLHSTYFERERRCMERVEKPETYGPNTGRKKYLRR